MRLVIQWTRPIQYTAFMTISDVVFNCETDLVDFKNYSKLRFPFIYIGVEMHPYYHMPNMSQSILTR